MSNLSSCIKIHFSHILKINNFRFLPLPFFSLFHFQSVSPIFIPLQNGNGTKTCRGNHWSLLVIDFKTKCVSHFDSTVTRNNSAIANSFYRDLGENVKEMRFEEADCYMQEANNCGVHLLVNVWRYLRKIKPTIPFDGSKTRREIIKFFEKSKHSLNFIKYFRLTSMN